jgi:hypothetical protein
MTSVSTCGGSFQTLRISSTCKLGCQLLPGGKLTSSNLVPMSLLQNPAAEAARRPWLINLNSSMDLQMPVWRPILKERTQLVILHFVFGGPLSAARQSDERPAGAVRPRGGSIQKWKRKRKGEIRPRPAE